MELQMVSPARYTSEKPPGLDSLRRAVEQKDQGGSKRYFIHEDVRVG